MTDRLVQILEKEKQKAEERVRKANPDPKTLNLALREIDINASTVKNFLKEMDKDGFVINDDFSKIRKDYDSIEEYRSLYNHIWHHFWEVQTNIPRLVERGEFKPHYAQFY